MSWQFKQDKIVIILVKQNHGYDWPDLRLKSTYKTLRELERNEKSYAAKKDTDNNFDTPFINNTCNHDNINKNAAGGVH